MALTFPICFADAAAMSLGFWAAPHLPTFPSNAQRDSSWS
jgi:hypothetical protein